MSTSSTSATGGEIGRIESFLRGLPTAPGVRVGPGDDGAVLDDGLVVSCDMSVEGVHFSLDWITPGEAGSRAVAVALSDLAAMGATPRGILVALALAPDGPAGVAGPTGPAGMAGSALEEELMTGVREAADRFSAPLLGGDLTVSGPSAHRSEGPSNAGLVIDVMVLGHATAPLLRSGARPGDVLWVSGPLGGAAAAVHAWQDGREPGPAQRRAFATPTPRLELGTRLAASGGATAALDLSDGLAMDAHRLARASGVRLVLDAWRLPRASPDPDHVLRGGDDYELLWTAPAEMCGADSRVRMEELGRELELELTAVGHVAEGDGVWLRANPHADPDADLEPLEPGGWDPFRDEPGGQS